MKVKIWLFVEVLLLVFLLAGATMCFATGCGGEIEFCSAVSSAKSGIYPITCQGKFPGNVIPGDVQHAYALLKVTKTTPGYEAIAVLTDPDGKASEETFDPWLLTYGTWYEVVPLPAQRLREKPGTWAFTYYVTPQNSTNREELCSAAFTVGEPIEPTLDIDGIWKDAGNTMSFYVQTYTAGSAVVIATKDLTSFYTFLDSDVSDGIDVDDLGNHGHHLSVTFDDNTHATAHLTPSGSAMQSYAITKNNGLPTSPSNHGIWKTPSCGNATMSYYIQTYDTGSAIVVGTPDLASFYVFLDANFSDGIDADELSGKPYHLSMSFASGGSGDAVERCVNAPVQGSHASTAASCSLLGTGSPPSTFTNSLGMTFKYIPPGTFTMGSAPDELGRDNDETQHQVTLTQGFYMQTTGITQGQWKAVMGSNPSYFTSCGNNCPVELVSWDDVQTFISKMNQRGEGTYRLPTEAEWEYGARADSTTAFANGDITETGCGLDPNLNAMGWYCYNSGDTTHPVAQKAPNAWGLYDMHGNVWEYCQDWYGDYPAGSVTNPTGPISGSYRVLRGGSLYDLAVYCRSAFRAYEKPGSGGSNLGARLVRSYP